jgi:ATP-dependent DNA helicase RecG
MALPINIPDLITGRTVEWERLEFKKGWNPLEVIQTVCAFANDVNNWGGGYIVVGIEENNGQPVLPPIGVNVNSIDGIQKELLQLCHEMRPYYFPVVEPVEFEGVTVLVIWVPGGETRPYKAPESLAKGNKNFTYFIRRMSSTKKATDQEARDLLQMSSHIPYDDQIQQNSQLTDLKLPLIQAHLATIGSELSPYASTMPFPELCRKMNIVAGPDEYLKPKNIGLMLFNDNPGRFFPCARIDLIQFKDEVGDSFSEKIFTGPVQQQLQDGLLYIKNTLISERVRKIEGKAEAVRFYNYPFEAIEEALVNTVYHRSYEDDSPIEIRVFPDRIEMVSYPGPLPPLTKAKLLAGDIVARKYRNRRIGDFLKELHLTEGRGTGIPKIRRAMSKNGSPEPTFDTDEELTYFLVVLPIHPAWAVQDTVQDGVQDGVLDDNLILRYCLRPKKRREIMSELGLYNNYDNFVKYTKHLLVLGLLELTIPDKPSSGNQQYRTTPLGEHYLNHGHILIDQPGLFDESTDPDKQADVIQF